MNNRLQDECVRSNLLFNNSHASNHKASSLVSSPSTIGSLSSSREDSISMLGSLDSIALSSLSGTQPILSPLDYWENVLKAYRFAYNRMIIYTTSSVWDMFFLLACLLGGNSPQGPQKKPNSILISSWKHPDLKFRVTSQHGLLQHIHVRSRSKIIGGSVM